MKAFLIKYKFRLITISIALSLFYFWLPSRLFNKPYSTVITDTGNQLLDAKIAEDGQWRFPNNDPVPAKFETCLLLFEDEYFRYHPGVNPVALFRSFITNIKAGKVKTGGSTITMQIARMMREKKQRGYIQKFIEMLLAIRIECSYSKQEILKIYADNAPFGSNVVGLNAAAWRYFGRSPENLSWAESATLAILPNAPALIYPGKNREALLAKRNRLLQKLYLRKTIDKQTYELAIREEIPGSPVPIPHSAPHLLDYCINTFGSGINFQTSINKYIQSKVNSLLNEHIAHLSGNSIYNACALVADVKSGKILAYIGNSTSEKHDHENYVDIIQSPRSTGSILKPFLYAFALNESFILPNSLLEDVPTQFGSYGPRNFHETYDGLVPASEALARSLNVPAVKLLSAYGVEKFQKRLKQLGFTTFSKPASHYGLSLILGGGEATLMEIASAYASLGRFMQSSGKNEQNNAYHALSVLQESDMQNEVHESGIITPSSIWFMLNAMTELVRPQDHIGWMQFQSKRKFAWKTGTSFGFRDAWAVGLNSKYIIAVWVGNADGEGRPELTGSSSAAPLLFNIANALTGHTWFNKPNSGFDKLKVCSESGYPASEICPNTVMEEIQLNGSKVKQCAYHKLIHLDETGKHRVNSTCYPVSKMQNTSWFIPTPTQEYFYKQKNLHFKPLPPYLPGCVNDENLQNLEIVYPRQGFKIYTPTLENGKKDNCVFKATHKSPEATLFWQLDGEYIGKTHNFHQLSTNPSPGSHTLSVTDESGEIRQCVFYFVDK